MFTEQKKKGHTFSLATNTSVAFFVLSIFDSKHAFTVATMAQHKEASQSAVPSTNYTLIGVILAVVLFIAVIAFLVAFYYRRRFQQLKQVAEPAVYYTAVSQGNAEPKSYYVLAGGHCIYLTVSYLDVSKVYN